MFVFVAEVNHQYTMKKQKNKELVEISVTKILDNADIGKDRCTLNKAEKDIFLGCLDAYFGLRMATKSEYTNKCSYSRGDRDSLEPHLKGGYFFYVTRK